MVVQLRGRRRCLWEAGRLKKAATQLRRSPCCNFYTMANLMYEFMMYDTLHLTLEPLRKPLPRSWPSRPFKPCMPPRMPWQTLT